MPKEKEKPIKTIFSIKLAPLDVPPERRLQTLAALGWISLATIVWPLSTILGILLAYYFSWGKYVVLGYLLWAYYDRETCEKGGRR